MNSPRPDGPYTRINNDLLDALIRIRLSGEQRQCFDFILRKTCGYHKDCDSISISQFERATGMKRNAVCRAIKELENKNLISLKKETSKTTSYCIETDFSKWQAVPKKRRLKIENPEIENLLVPKLGHTKERFKEIKPFCQKPKITSTSDSPAFDFITGIFSNLESHLNRWKEAYPAICVEAEIKKSAAWLTANPKNRKSNYARFLNLWLSKAQDRAPRQQQAPTAPDAATRITSAHSAGIRQVLERRSANAA